MQFKKKVPKRNTSKEVVLATEDIKGCHQRGLQGLKKNKNKIVLYSPPECGGSVEIDDCTTRKYPNDNRWDYVFDYRGEVFFVEVHSANTGEIRTVLRKFQWLIGWLSNNAPELNTLKSKSKPAFYWVQSGGYNILKNSPQERAIVQKGLKPVSRITLN
ncbi:MAG: hypothetical protein ABI237_14900 [Ginsengibacter sp.]